MMIHLTWMGLLNCQLDSNNSTFALEMEKFLRRVEEGSMISVKETFQAFLAMINSMVKEEIMECQCSMACPS